VARILLKNIQKRYGKDKTLAVKDFTLEVEDGEFLVMVGPSGCGKSTTLRMIAGLEEITGGELHIGDKLVNHLPPKDRDIAMVFQNYALYPNMNVFENIAFGLRLRKIPKHDLEIAVRRAARVLEIENYLSRKPAELSGGQRQRVALGRAIVRNPQVFLMDEPLSNLDAKLRVQMRAEIIALHKQLGVTTVYVTHDQTEAMTMGHRIVVMKDGVIQQVDTPEQVYSNPTNMFVASFIGSPPINLIEGKLIENEHGKLEFHTNRFFIELTAEQTDILRKQNKVNRTIMLGIRCENLHLESDFREKYPNAQIPAVQKMFELMGADMYLYTDIGMDDHNRMIIRVHPSHKFKDDEELSVTVDLEKALFFDRDTGENLMA